MNPKQYIEQFEEKFGKDGPDKNTDSIGREAGCDDCCINIEERAEHKSHLILIIIGVLKEQEGVVEGIMKKTRNFPMKKNGENWNDWNDGYDQALTDYKLSLQKVREEWETLLVLPRL